MDAQTQSSGLRARFVGAPGQFLGMALRGSLLLIPTFAFYRFWLNTDLRRHLWSHTLIGNDALEYTGRARELLIGFLVALAVLAPTYVLLFWVQIESQRAIGGVGLPVYLSILVTLNALFIYTLGYYGVYRARRYRATRTVLRGVRFLMGGSGWSYARRAIFWDFLTVITFGLALPWRNAALERYKMSHTAFGDLQGSFEGTGWTLFKRGWWIWAFGVGVIVAVIAISASRTVSANDVIDPIPQFIPSLLILIALLGIPLYTAIDLRWRLQGLRFGAAYLDSDLKKRAVVWRYVKAGLAGFGVVLAFLIIMALIGFLIYAILSATNFDFTAYSPQTPGLEGSPLQGVVGVVFAVMFYVPILVAFNVIQLQIMTRGLWRLAVESVTIYNVEALDDVVARGGAADSFGEGLADALDFGGAGV